MKSLFLGLVLIFAASDALAWGDCPGATGVLTPDASFASVTRGQTICHDTAVNAATDSGLLDTHGCNGFDILVGPDMVGTDTALVAQVYRCVARRTDKGCTKLLTDTDGNGVENDTTLDGTTLMRQAMNGKVAPYIWIDVTTAPGASAVSRFSVTCH